MRPFSRSDLGRLYLSTRRGLTDFAYVGDGSVDGVTSATTVSMVGRATLAGSKAWTGTVTARPAHALVAAASSNAPVDLLILYGEQCDVVKQTGYNEAIIIEGVIFTADQYTALTDLTSAARAIVTSTHTFAAENMLRLPVIRDLYRVKTLAGAVVAICAAGPRIYALVAAPLGGDAVSLTLAWTDAPTAGSWHTALIDAAFSEPTALTPAGSWAQCAMTVFNDRIYIATVADFICVDTPTPGVATLYPTYVRTPSYAPYGSPDQLCRVVGLHVEGDLLYAGTMLGQLWRIAAPGTVLARSVGGTANHTFLALDNDDLALLDDTNIRVVGDGGRQRNFTGWAGNARYACGGVDSLIVATADGKLQAADGATWAVIWDFGAALISMVRATHNLFYAVTASGTQGSQLWMSVSGGRIWTEVGGIADAICLYPLPDGKCLVGCQTLVPGADRSTGAGSITGVQTSGYAAATAPSEQLIVSQ